MLYDVRVFLKKDSQISRLAGQEQAWISDGWHARFNMPPSPNNYGPGLTHTREQVARFRADAIFQSYKSALLRPAS